MIELVDGNILDAQVDVIVNPVNCDGVMGAGLAKAIATRWPETVPSYQHLCSQGKFDIGYILWAIVKAPLPRYIACFPTKYHWVHASRLEYIKHGLPSLVRDVEQLGITSMACPMLGCGLGGLSVRVVEPLLREAFEPIAAKVFLYKSR